MTRGPEVVGRMEESASSQPVALVTGASRDIGRGITEALIKEGFAVIANHRDPQKDKRNIEIRGLIKSTGGEWHIGDITTAEGRSDLVDNVDKRGGKLDLLVLNAAGPSRELNVVANLALVDAFLPRMNEGGVIIFPQSTVGHFVDLIDPSQLTAAGYENVAPTKNEAEKELRKKQAEADERGVKIFFPCPPEVSDTTNIRLFNYRDPEASAKSAAFSRSLGLPEAVTIKDVGEKVAELARRKDELPQGYTDFFNETIDARPILRTIYDADDAVYIDTVEENGVAHAIVSDLRVEEANIRLVEEVEGNLDRATSTVLVKDEHCKGHFGVLPGHKGIRVVEETIRGVYERNNDDGMTLQLTDADEIKFSAMVVPGNTIHTVVEKVGQSSSGAIYDATITSGKEVCYEMKGIYFRRVAKTAGDEIRSHQIAEIAAQAAGAASGAFEGRLAGKDVMPIYNGIEKLSVISVPKKGEALRVTSRLSDTGNEDKVVASVDIYVGNQLVAWANKLEATMLQGSTVRGLKRRAERRNAVNQSQGESQ